MSGTGLDRQSVESFLYRSARLLDAGAFDDWLGLCLPEVSYVVTTRSDVKQKHEVCIIRDNYDRLGGRFQSIRKYWHAEHPATETLHVITNIEVEPSPDGDDSAIAHSCFVVYTARSNRILPYPGSYRDVIRRVDGEWKFQERVATLISSFIPDGRVTFIV